MKLKPIAKPISFDCKFKFNSTNCNSNQKWNNKTFQCECKNTVPVKKIIIRILTHVFLRIASI